jgi:hypothetical protein
MDFLFYFCRNISPSAGGEQRQFFPDGGGPALAATEQNGTITIVQGSSGGIFRGTATYDYIYLYLYLYLLYLLYLYVQMYRYTDVYIDI